MLINYSLTWREIGEEPRGIPVAGAVEGQNALEPFFGNTDGVAPIQDSDFVFARSVVDTFGLEAQSCLNFVPSLLKSGQ